MAHIWHLQSVSIGWHCFRMLSMDNHAYQSPFLWPKGEFGLKF